MVIITAICQAVPSLQIQVQEEDFDSVSWGQLDGPLTFDIVGVKAGILRAGEIPFDDCVDFLAFGWVEKKGGKRFTKPTQAQGGCQDCCGQFTCFMPKIYCNRTRFYMDTS